MENTALMRPLPAQPSLEHLRKEAKQQLVQLRGRAHSAQLADAQHLVARTYGFSNWQALKREVDRRREALGLMPPPLLGECFPRPRRPTGFRAMVFSPCNAEQTFFSLVAFPALGAQAKTLAILAALLFQ